MQRNLKRLFLLLIVLLLQAGGWTSVYGAVISQQNDSSSEFNFNTSNLYSPGVNLGNGLSGQPYHLLLKVKADNTDYTCSLGDTIRLQGYTDGTYTTGTGGEALFYCDTTITNATTFVDFLLRADISTLEELNPSHYYRMTNNGFYTQLNNIFGNGSNQIYYVLDDIAFNFTTSRIVDEISPVVTPTSSTLVNFEFDFYNSGYEGFDKVGVEIKDLTAGFTYGPVEDNLAVTGFGTYQQNYQLVEGHGHIWRAYLRNSASSTRLYGRWIGMIDVVTASASSTPYIQAGATTTSFFDFLNVPELLKTKKPTGYLFQIADIIDSLGSTTATTTGSINYNFSVYASGTPLATVGNIQLFGTSTVTELIPSYVLALFNTLVVSIMYIGVGFHIYHKIMKFA